MILSALSLILALLPQESAVNASSNDSGDTFRFPIWYTPSSVNRIYGLAIMPFGSGFIYDKPQSVTGLALHGAGVGAVLPLVPFQFYDKYKDIGDNRDLEQELGRASVKVVDRAMDIDRERVVDSVAASEFGPSPSLVSINGGLFSLTGTLSYKMNGVSVSMFSTAHGFINGISACPIYNRTFHLNGVTIGAFNDSYHVNGIQIGIFNSTYYLNGIQIGIINRNKKRTTPILNWSMDK